jgi:hypothetical protein
MNDFWTNLFLEISLFIFLGIFYYFYQKKKIIHYENNKTPLVMGFILQSCLTEKKDLPQPQLDALIESIDDYLHNKAAHPPLALLRHFSESVDCSKELKEIIKEGIIEIEDGDRKK